VSPQPLPPPSTHLPVRRRLEPPQVGLELPREDLERGRLADAVDADEPEDLPGAGHGEPGGGVAVAGGSWKWGNCDDGIDKISAVILVPDSGVVAWQLAVGGGEIATMGYIGSVRSF
jgi:hypothetical protein